MFQEGKIDYIYSEDSDVLAFGCVNIVRSLKKNNTVLILNQKIIDKFRKDFMNKVIAKNAKNDKADYFFELSV